MKVRQILGRIKHSFRVFYILYADTPDLLVKAQKALHPLPEGCELVKLTNENRDRFKCKWDVNQMLSFRGEAWAVVDNTSEIVGYHYGAYRGNNSLFFKVRKCDYEHTEIMVDERYRRKGLAVYLLYHAIKNLDPKYVKNNRICTMIKPDNIPSIKLHELIGFKITRKVILVHKMKKMDGQYIIKNFPHYTV